MSKRNTVQLSVTEEEQRQFKAIAAKHGYLWGDEGNQTAFYKAISHEAVETSIPPSLDSPQARKILELLCNKTPFRFSYADAAGKPFVFTVRYGERVLREGYYYLECWCDETEDNQDLEPLRHNWCFRFDRVTNADAFFPLDASTWREEGMATIPVQFELYRGLAHAFREGEKDRLDSWDGKVKVVTRRITSTFWFIREIIRYGKDCKVLSQSGVRERLVEQLEGAIAHYRPTPRGL
jgi:predicted DNA-binding transcriptional regulator YafY